MGGDEGLLDGLMDGGGGDAVDIVGSDGAFFEGGAGVDDSASALVGGDGGGDGGGEGGLVSIVEQDDHDGVGEVLVEGPGLGQAAQEQGLGVDPDQPSSSPDNHNKYPVDLQQKEPPPSTTTATATTPTATMTITSSFTAGTSASAGSGRGSSAGVVLPAIQGQGQGQGHHHHHPSITASEKLGPRSGSGPDDQRSGARVAQGPGLGTSSSTSSLGAYERFRMTRPSTLLHEGQGRHAYAGNE